MQILSEQLLATTMRRLADRVKQRLWVASPYIGGLRAVRSILGRRWLDESSVDVRLLIDVENTGALTRSTVERFHSVGQVKTLLGLHAKIYIVDDQAIIASANLTEAAFAKRYETGVLLADGDAADIIGIFDRWWKDDAKIPEDNWLGRLTAGGKQASPDEIPGQPLPTIWKLGKDPGDPFSAGGQKFKDYRAFLRCYEDFAALYKDVQRVWNSGPLYLETDSFLNYLFHEADDKPSKPYLDLPPRNFTQGQRKEQIRHSAKRYAKWVVDTDQEVERVGRWKLLRKLLSPDNLHALSRDQITEVADNLHCMRSVALAKARFLNPDRNSLVAIRKAWSTLLNPGKIPLETAMTECSKGLYGFGRSSVQELLGWSDPNRYPIRNTNSNAGLRFFGYDVSVY